jgi:hypothetical protein
MGWTTVPVTLVDDSKEIVSGGLLIPAFEREEVYHWFLSTLHEIAGGTLRTIFSDEDSALLPAIGHLRTVHPEIAHRLCVFHKRRNFEAKVRAATRDTAVSTEAIRLFDQFVYAKTRDVSEDSLTQLQLLMPNLAPYIATELASYTQQFTEAFRGEALTLGYHSIGVSESSNHMLLRNLPPGTHTLVEIRRGYSRAHQIKWVTTVEEIQCRFQLPHFLNEDFDIGLQRRLSRWIDRLVEQVKRWQICHSDSMGEYRAISGNTVWRLRYNDHDPPQCECNESTGTGLPCRHMIVLFREMGGDKCFPVQMISPRWIPNVSDVQIPALPMFRIAENDQVLNTLSDMGPGTEDGSADAVQDDAPEAPAKRRTGD